jgi:hypothetical protein
MIKKLFPVFIVGLLVVSAILFLFPINLFDGEIVYQHGLQEVVVKAPLSLSYFIGIGYDEADMVQVKTFYLQPIGYLMAFLILFGLPALVSYRIYLEKMKKQNNDKIA